MGFLCSNNDDKKIVSLDKQKEVVNLRNLGLDNVYNINTEVDFCSEIFVNPSYYVIGATGNILLGFSGTTSQPINLTGCTTGSTNVYNLTYTPNFNVEFFITGNTQYTGYTGDFCYKIFNDNWFGISNPNTITEGSEIISNCVPYSGITANTIVHQFLEGLLPKTWSQYMIRPYCSFISKDCNIGKYFNDWDSKPQQNVFTNGDYYFVTVVDPPTPILPSPLDSPKPDFNFVQDILLKNGQSTIQGPQAINGVLNYFILKYKPTDNTSVMLFVNGVKLTNGYDYRVLDRGFTQPPIIEFFYELKYTDWVVANYMSGTAPSTSNYDYSKYFVNNLLVQTITVDTNPGYNVALNNNSITGKQEFYCTQPISKNDSIIVFINGVELVQNQQFFLSESQDNRIIFNNVANIIIGDVISIFAVSPNFISGGNDYGSITEPNFTVSWSSEPTLPKNVSGRFIVQIFDNNDISNTVLYQQETDFVDNLVNYELTFNSISLNIYYRFKVIFETKYTTYLDNRITTCSYAEGYFDTANDYINNTY